MFFQISLILHSTFSNIIMDTLNNGLRSHTYVLRARVLKDFFEIKKSELHPELHILDAQIVCGKLASMLLEEASFQEQAKCLDCSNVKINNLKTVYVEDIFLRINTPQNFVKAVCSMENGKCNNCGSKEVLFSLVNTGKKKNILYIGFKRILYLGN